MYRLRKSIRSSSVNLINTISGNTLQLGRPTVAMLKILSDNEGFTIVYSKTAPEGEKCLNYQSPWDIEVSEQTAKLLTGEIMPSEIMPKKKDNTTSKQNSNNPYASMSLRDALLFGLK